MSHYGVTSEIVGPAAEVYLLGTIDYEWCLALEQRLIYEAGGRDDGQVAMLLCEHPAMITVGRQGVPSDIRLDERERISRGIAVRWVNRGGGCLAHLPGQLAVYPIVPLRWHGLTVGEYLDRLQSAMAAALAELDVNVQTREGRYGVWGRTGLLAAVGVAVKSWVTYHGAFLNVHPAMNLVRSVVADPLERQPMSSLAAERQRRMSMTRVRETVMRHVTASLGCNRCHVYTGHPLLAEVARTCRENAARVG